MVQMSICRGAALQDKIGIPVRSSEDLVHFQYEGTVLSEHAIRQGRDNGAYPQTINFWAPYVEYVEEEYRMYYSATRRFGSSESRIWLAAAAKHPLDHLRTAAWWRTPGELMTRCQTRLTRMLYGTKSAAIWCMAHSLAESISRS